jgi:hypothetical protein
VFWRRQGSGLIESGFTPLLLNDNNGDCCKTKSPTLTLYMDKIDYSGYVNRVDLFMKGSPTEKRSRRPERRALMMKFTEILSSA